MSHRVTTIDQKRARCPEGTADATSETTPFHIWRDHIWTAACRALGTDAGRESVRLTLASEECRVRMVRWYQAGEPVWMAADTLIAFAVGAIDAARECNPLEELRTAVRQSLRRGSGS